VWHRHAGLPDDWSRIVDDNVAAWPRFDVDEREKLAADADWLLRHKHWEAAHGFELTEAVTVTIAVQAAMLVVGLDVDELREVSAIVVYPTAMQSVGMRAGPVSGTVSDGVVPILGEAHDHRGPVLLAWDDALAASVRPGHGHNVVFHEFAHKIDMFDAVSDGTPWLGRRVDRERWVEVCSEAFRALQAGVDRPPLDPYGATNPAEFFAVATEAFLDAPGALARHEPDLYDLFRDFYRQDPAARWARGG
jgi:Mlc titration factor MtfA (ptsG expression regulator)